MKQLSEVLKNTLNTAKQTMLNPAERKFSLTKNVGIMITEARKLYNPIAEPAVNNRELLVLLKSGLGLRQDLTIKERTIFTEYGTEYKPCGLNCSELSAEQKQKGLKIFEVFNQRMKPEDISKLLTRLKYTTASKDNDDFDNEIRFVIYIDEMLKYPADVANKALTSRFKFFPTLSELIEICEEEMLIRKLIKIKLGG